MKIGDFERMPAQQGWQCPICGRVYSPTAMMCLYCGNEEEIVSTNYTIDYSHHESTTKTEDKYGSQ